MTARELLEAAPEVKPDQVLPDPEPLESVAKLKAWPVGAILPPELERFGLAFADRLCLDPGPVMLALLTATTALTNGRVWIQPDPDNSTWQEPTALWLAVVMPVSSGKTPMLKAALSPVWAIEKELREEHEQAMETYKSELAAWEAQKRSERGPKPEPPKASRLLAQDATKEALADMLTINPGLLAFHDELTGLFKTWAREDKGPDRAFYLAAYSGAPVSVDRIVRGSSFIERPVLSLLGFIQPGPFRERILEAQNESAGADGLLQRFVVVTAQERPWADERPPISPDAVNAYREHLANIWSFSKTSNEIAFRFSDEAQAVWHQWENQVERELRNPDLTEAWRALLGKRKGQTARLAALLAVLWGEKKVVSATTLRRAIALVLWLEPHARRIWQRALSGNDEPVMKLARKLANGALEVRGKRLEVFTERDITRSQVAGLGLVGEARRVLGVLVAHGWLLREGEKYRVNPRVKEVAGEL